MRGLLRTKTQKATGIRVLALSQLNRFTLFPNAKLAASTHVVPLEEIPPDFWDLAPLMVRPCPMEPRHGWVDSRPVETPDQLRGIIAEVKAALEPGWPLEVIVQPLIRAESSAVISRHGVAIGRGRAGATSGRAFMIHAPVKREEFRHTASNSSRYLHGHEGGARVSNFIVKEYMIHLDDVQHDIHFEAVTGRLACSEAQAYYIRNTEAYFLVDEATTQIVQVRPAPRVDHMDSNWIPFEFERCNIKIIRGTGDLLEFARMLADCKGRNDVIVHQPGAALTSHYASHAITNGIPFVTDEHLEAKYVPSGTASWFDDDYDSLIAAGLLSAPYWVEHGSGDHFRQTPASVIALQAFAAQPPSVRSVRLLVAGTAMLLRSATTALIGEARHWVRSGPGAKFDFVRHGKAVRPTGLTSVKFLGTNAQSDVARTEIYETLAPVPLYDMIRVVPLLRVEFMTSGWHDSYGGHKWAACASATWQTFLAFRRFLTKPSRETMFGLVQTATDMINTVHNGGRIVNKFCGSSILDAISRYPQLPIANYSTDLLSYVEDHEVSTKALKSVCKRLANVKRSSAALLRAKPPFQWLRDLYDQEQPKLPKEFESLIPGEIPPGYCGAAHCETCRHYERAWSGVDVRPFFGRESLSYGGHDCQGTEG